MKVVSIILFILGGLLVALNLLVFLTNPPEIKSAEIVDEIAFYIGYSAGFILGCIFILIGYLIGKRSRRKKEKLKAKQSIDSLLK